MKYFLDLIKIKRLLSDYYTLTGLRVALFDESFKVLLTYPERGCELCNRFAETPEGQKRCHVSDDTGITEAKKKGSIHIYRCHAGLGEVCFPIRCGGEIAAYIIFGQLRLKGDIQTDDGEIFARCAGYIGDDAALADMISRIRSTNQGEIEAACRIMEICINFVLLEHLVSARRDRTWETIDAYIHAHLTEEMPLAETAAAIFVSQSTISHKTRRMTGQSYNGYIRQLRFERACKILTDTDESIAKIARDIGYDDYNYFSRVFKKACGSSPSNYRKRYRQI